MAAERQRTLLLGAVICAACFVEANAATACWWAGFVSLPARRFQLVSNATRYLEQFPPDQNRVYTRVAMFAEEFNQRPRLEGQNLTMLYGLQNVAGIEPLIFDRYSRALGNVGPDSVTPRAGQPLNDDLFDARSHVLDLLNTTHVVTYAGPYGLVPDEITRPDHLPTGDIKLSVPPGATARLTGAEIESDQIALVTTLANSVTTPQGTEVATLHVQTEAGRTVDLALRAGVDTAEWAHERADVRAGIKHKLAPVFDSAPADAANSFPSLRYQTRLELGAPLRVRRIEIVNQTHDTTLTIWKAALVNTRSTEAATLAPDTRSDFWTRVYTDEQAEILQNTRACPRAWLVSEVEVVDGDEALRRIRGESARAFDPRRTALVEARADELPQLPGGQLPAASAPRVVTYEPNRLTLTTDAPTATMLVLSEIYYPGWEATIDGQRARIFQTDYLLRGMFLPPGTHTIEMRYTAPGARHGVTISVLTICVIIGLIVYAWRTRVQ